MRNAFVFVSLGSFFLTWLNLPGRLPSLAGLPAGLDRSAQYDLPRFQYISTVCQAQRHIRVLLNQQHRSAGLVDLLETLNISRTNTGASPIDGSSSSIICPRLIKARPTASICCSPPESVPLNWFWRSFKRGKMPKTRSKSPPDLTFIFALPGSQFQIFHHCQVAKDAAPFRHLGDP